MRRSISKAQGFVDNNAATKSPRHGQGIIGMQRFIQGVLMQDDRLIAYISRKLRKHEENYATHELELLAIVYSLRFWKHMIGRKFELKTDHCRLQHIFT
jgi:hypothetical protein